ncbi:unnamed protein product [Calypogeia fissa]
MFAEMQLLASVQHPTVGVSFQHLHNAHVGHSKAMTPSVLPLHSARFPRTGKSLVTNIVAKKCRRKAICRASWGEDISQFEDVEAEIPLDSSVFEEVYPSVQRVKKRFGTQVKGMPIPQSTLVPDDWKDVQQYLHRGKKERKQETLARQLEWAKRRALEERLTRDERRRLRDQELVAAGAVESSDNALPNEVEDLQMGVETLQNSVSGRARPRDFRSELQFTSVEEIAQSLSGEENLETTSESDAARVGKKDFDDVQTQSPAAAAASEKKHLLTPEERALLKSKKLNFARISSSKWSPLHTLAASGQVYLAAELIKRAVDLDSVDGDGLTPLHRAVQAGRKNVVRLLLQAGANAQVLDNEGATLLHYSAQIGDHSICKLLQRHGVDVNVADADGWTPLHVAVQSGRLELIKALVYRGANIDIANKDGNTALDLALAFGGTFNFYDAIKFLKKMSVFDSISRAANIEGDNDEAS